MELRKFFPVIVVMLILGCGGKGTEVVSPPNPNQGPVPVKTEAPQYEVIVDLPVGWHFYEYGIEREPGPEVYFQDTDPTTITVAQLTRLPSSGVTVFFSYLKSGQSLRDFIRIRHPEGDITLDSIEDASGRTATFGTYQDNPPGPHGGAVLDVYVAVEGTVLWMKMEATGTDQQRQSFVEEFNQILASLQFEPKI